ncbi:MAG: site-specific integrase [Hyphomonadaceae bacterium]|nr:site-specific integrase [Hyphomonadaceae bacterium]
MARNVAFKAKLNNVFFKSFKGGPAVDRIWDTDLPGFGLRVRRQSHPDKWSWICAYRHKVTGKQVVITLGTFRQKTPDEARRAAKEAVGKANTSDDLWSIRQSTQEALAEQRRQPSMDTLWQEYFLAEGRHKKWRIRLEGLWRQQLQPFFGRMKVRDVGPQDVERFKALHAATPYNTNRGLAVLSRLFTLAVKWGFRKGCAPEHPVKGVERYPEPPRERYFTEEEIGRILEAIEGLRSKAGRLAFLMLIETGARSAEVKRAHWDQFEFESDRTIWTVEASNTKTARPVARVLSSGLSARLQTWRTLSDELRSPEAGAPWVFPNVRSPERPMLTLKGAWEVIKKKAHLRHGDRIHDLRHTVATMLLRKGIPLASVGDYLGHATPLTTRRYAHVMIDRQGELTKAMTDVLHEARDKHATRRTAS